MPRWRVHLLAHLDDPTALLVTGRAPAASGGEGWLADRLQGLGAWGQVACVRAGLALARCALAVSGRAPSAAVQAAAAWVDCPCQPHLAACALQPRGPIRRLDRFDNLATMVCSPLGPDAAPSARQTLQSLESVLHEARSLVPRAAPDPARAGDRRLWAAVVAELRPWVGAMSEASTEPPAPL